MKLHMHREPPHTNGRYGRIPREALGILVRQIRQWNTRCGDRVIGGHLIRQVIDRNKAVGKVAPDILAYLVLEVMIESFHAAGE
jgi:hypothetical protein